MFVYADGFVGSGDPVAKTSISCSRSCVEGLGVGGFVRCFVNDQELKSFVGLPLWMLSFFVDFQGEIH